jgi:hypothetical protein
MDFRDDSPLGLAKLLLRVPHVTIHHKEGVAISSEGFQYFVFIDPAYDYSRCPISSVTSDGSGDKSEGVVAFEGDGSWEGVPASAGRSSGG